MGLLSLICKCAPSKYNENEDSYVCVTFDQGSCDESAINARWGIEPKAYSPECFNVSILIDQMLLK